MRHSGVDAGKLEKLKSLKLRFRQLGSGERESLSVSLLKINLGVHSERDESTVKSFLGDFRIPFEAGKLDTFLNFLHDSSDDVLPDISGWFKPEDFLPGGAELLKSKPGLPPYREDEVDTLKDQVPPFKPRG